MLAGLTFLAPLALAALIVLPALYFLLRLTPPPPRRRRWHRASPRPSSATRCPRHHHGQHDDGHDGRDARTDLGHGHLP